MLRILEEIFQSRIREKIDGLIEVFFRHELAIYSAPFVAADGLLVDVAVTKEAEIKIIIAQ
jgi:hypothetical protein